MIAEITILNLQVAAAVSRPDPAKLLRGMISQDASM
jgi:hypothetical protein